LKNAVSIVSEIAFGTIPSLRLRQQRSQGRLAFGHGHLGLKLAGVTGPLVADWFPGRPRMSISERLESTASADGEAGGERPD